MIGLLELLVVVVEVSKLFGQDVGVRREIKGGLAVLLLHAHQVKAKAVLARNLERTRKAIDLLVLVEALIQVRLARAT